MIDWKRVDELRQEIGAEDFCEVAGMFLEEADQTVERLSVKVANAEVEALLHFLKGSALNLGLSELARICQEGERMAASGDGSAFDMSRLTAVYAASKAAFIGRQPNEAAA